MAKATGYKKGRQIELVLALIPGGFYLEETAAKKFKEMYAAAKKDRILLKVNTAFRTMEHQKKFYAKYEAGIAAGRNPAPVARPGYSNHQSGIAVDINRAPGDDPKTAAPDSPVDLWLASNASLFGFYRTVKKEPWHWEYLGV